MQRIKIDGIREHPWFQMNYVSTCQGEESDVSLDDVCAVFDDIEVVYCLVYMFFYYVIHMIK